MAPSLVAVALALARDANRRVTQHRTEVVTRDSVGHQTLFIAAIIVQAPVGDARRLDPDVGVLCPVRRARAEAASFESLPRLLFGQCLAGVQYLADAQ